MIAGLKDTTKPRATQLAGTLLARDYKGPSNLGGTVIVYVKN